MKSRVHVFLLALAVAFGTSWWVSNLSYSKKKGTGSIHVAGKTVKVSYDKHKAAGIKCKDCHVKHKDGKFHREDCTTCHGKKKEAPTMKKMITKTCVGCHVKRKKAGEAKTGPQTFGELAK